MQSRTPIRPSHQPFIESHSNSRRTGSPQLLVAEWLEAVRSRDASRVLSLYGSDAFLWEDSDAEPKVGSQEIKSHFDPLLNRSKIEVKTRELRFRELGDGVVSTSGIHEFVLGGANLSQPAGRLRARFSFVLKRSQTGSWTIVDHHTSQLPEMQTEIVHPESSPWLAGVLS